MGYPLTARLLLDAFHNLAALSVFNHLLGLGIAGLIYAVLLRRGVSPWIAALATGPVLLDGFQLLIEQMVMSEPQFEFFVVLGVGHAVAVRPRPDLVTASASRRVVRGGSAHAGTRPVAGRDWAAVLCAGSRTPARPACRDFGGLASGVRPADDRLRRLQRRPQRHFQRAFAGGLDPTLRKGRGVGDLHPAVVALIRAAALPAARRCHAAHRGR